MADIPRHIRDPASLKPVGIYHHGSQTDKFWTAGKIEFGTKTSRLGIRPCPSFVQVSSLKRANWP